MVPIRSKMIGVGTKHTAVRKFIGRRVEATNEYVVYEPNKEVTFKGTAGSADFQHSYLTESTAEGTRLTSSMVMEPKGLFGLAEPLITSNLRREFVANLAELKDLLETLDGGPAADRRQNSSATRR